MYSGSVVYSLRVVDPAVKSLNTRDLIQLFDQLFYTSTNTRLISGDDEPVYLPADEAVSFNRLVFAHGFFESALHEISHWCLAGSERRKQVDFGYWYVPDGRTEAQQRAFEQVEVKPQAVEWLLSEACGRRFHISTDNLDGDPEAVEAGRCAFAHRVHTQAHIYLRDGLPPRAELLKAAFLEFYQRQGVFSEQMFRLEQL